jgi:hypothetical protein
VNENAVLYALSTLAQTCAALAAFVGAIGLFLLQSLREQRRTAEQAMRTSLVDVYDNYNVVMYVRSTAEVVKQAEKVRGEPSRASGKRAQDIEDALQAWNGFAPRFRGTSATFAVFEAWNLLVILVSLGGFAHVPALTGQAWATWATWLIALVTVAVSGVSVFVWLERG